MPPAKCLGAQYRKFLAQTLANGVRVSAEGAIHFVCIDWRHIGDLIDVGHKLYGAMLNLVVWNKSNAGQGSFYRSQHELIGVFRVGENPHRNNVELGRFGRNRSNVWTYAGVNTFGRDRMEALSAHPTVKPVALVADALLDCTARGDAVLDQFAGSGTTILAAEKVGRIGFGIEYEPRYVDVAIRRWQKSTKLEATLAGDGRSFEDIGAARSSSNDAAQHHHSKPGARQAQPKRLKANERATLPAACVDPQHGPCEARARTRRALRSELRRRLREPEAAPDRKKRPSARRRLLRRLWPPPEGDAFPAGPKRQSERSSKRQPLGRGDPAGYYSTKDRRNRKRQDAPDARP